MKTEGRGFILYLFSPESCKIKIAFHSQMSKVCCSHIVYCTYMC